MGCPKRGVSNGFLPRCASQLQPSVLGCNALLISPGMIESPAQNSRDYSGSFFFFFPLQIGKSISMLDFYKWVNADA